VGGGGHGDRGREGGRDKRGRGRARVREVKRVVEERSGENVRRARSEGVGEKKRKKKKTTTTTTRGREGRKERATRKGRSQRGRAEGPK
jgi:hypothetical protein